MKNVFTVVASEYPGSLVNKLLLVDVDNLGKDFELMYGHLGFRADQLFRVKEEHRWMTARQITFHPANDSNKVATSAASRFLVIEGPH